MVVQTVPVLDIEYLSSISAVNLPGFKDYHTAGKSAFDFALGPALYAYDQAI